MMEYSSALFALLVLMHVSHIKGATKPTKYPPKLGGGADGAAGSEFLKGTADVSHFFKAARGCKSSL
jgi:hypothetical protein